MELSEALPILQRLYAPLFSGMSLRISGDHICDREDPPEECPYPDSAKYTKMDALLDTPQALEDRLRRGGPLKPSQDWPLFFTHIRGTVRTIKGSLRERIE
jgi:hypothetical protein